MATGHVEDPELGKYMVKHGPQEASRRLIELACERGGDDNITVSIARVENAT